MRGVIKRHRAALGSRPTAAGHGWRGSSAPAGVLAKNRPLEKETSGRPRHRATDKLMVVDRPDDCLWSPVATTRQQGLLQQRREPGDDRGNRAIAEDYANACCRACSSTSLAMVQSAQSPGKARKTGRQGRQGRDRQGSADGRLLTRSTGTTGQALPNWQDRYFDSRLAMRDRESGRTTGAPVEAVGQSPDRS